MRSLIVFAVILGSFNVLAFVSNKDVTGSNDRETIIGRINAGYINLMEEDIKKTKAFYEQTVANLTDTDSNEEGKIRAGIINLIERELEELEALKNQIGEDEEIIDADLKSFKTKNLLIQELIGELVA